MLIHGHFLDGKTSKRVQARLEVIDSAEPYIWLHTDEPTAEIKNAVMGSTEKNSPTNTPVDQDTAIVDLTNNPRVTTSSITPSIKAPQISPQKCRLEFQDLTVESRLGSTPREIVISGNQLFITDDNDGVDSLIRYFRELARDPGRGGAGTNIGKLHRSHSLLHKLESNLTLIAASAVCTVALLWVLFAYGLPAAANVLAFKLPNTTIQKISSSLPLLDKTIFDESELDPARQEEIRQLFLPYIAQYPELNANIQFRKAGMSNAFSLPNGDIVFTDQFVAMASNNNELIAVLFHEMGHLEHRHLTRRAIQGSLVTVLIFMITGDLDTIDAVIGLPTLLADMAYSRDFEREADAFAIQALQKNNIPIQSFADVMEKFAKENASDEESFLNGKHSSKALEYLSSHPSTKERIEMVKQLQQAEN